MSPLLLIIITIDPLIKYVLSLQILAQGNLDYQDVQSAQHLQVDTHQESAQACGEKLVGQPSCCEKDSRFRSIHEKLSIEYLDDKAP